MEVRMRKNGIFFGRRLVDIGTNGRIKPAIEVISLINPAYRARFTGSCKHRMFKQMEQWKNHHIILPYEDN